ncbi:hypothetical protein DXG01_016292 [Tephrocybe rancida]|nr:hypothetical protein DXG01_016292 [Tephrocybe rancida]
MAAQLAGAFYGSCIMEGMISDAEFPLHETLDLMITAFKKAGSQFDMKVFLTMLWPQHVKEGSENQNTSENDNNGDLNADKEPAMHSTRNMDARPTIHTATNKETDPNPVTKKTGERDSSRSSIGIFFRCVQDELQGFTSPCMAWNKFHDLLEQKHKRFCGYPHKYLFPGSIPNLCFTNVQTLSSENIKLMAPLLSMSNAAHPWLEDWTAEEQALEEGTEAYNKVCLIVSGAGTPVATTGDAAENHAITQAATTVASSVETTSAVVVDLIELRHEMPIAPLPLRPTAGHGLNPNKRRHVTTGTTNNECTPRKAPKLVMEGGCRESDCHVIDEDGYYLDVGGEPPYILNGTWDEDFYPDVSIHDGVYSYQVEDGTDYHMPENYEHHGPAPLRTRAAPPHVAPPHGVPHHGLPPCAVLPRHAVPPHVAPPHAVRPHAIPPHNVALDIKGHHTRPSRSKGILDSHAPILGPSRQAHYIQDGDDGAY